MVGLLICIPTIDVNKILANKPKKKSSVRNSNAALVRSEADSNRCRRFCRPLVKPLAHQTIVVKHTMYVITECKYIWFLSKYKIFHDIFLFITFLAQ